jgi:hypothetical protein
MHHRPNYLFQGAPVHAVIQRNQARAMTELESRNEDTILGRPTEDLIKEVLAAYTPQFPQLRESDIWLEEYETTTEVPIRGYYINTDRRGGTETVRSHVVAFHVPFDGDGTLFGVEPSSRSIPGPAAEINGQELIIRLGTHNKTEVQVRGELNNVIQSIKQHLSTLGTDLQHVTAQLEAPARSYVEQRKAQLLKSKSLVASLGFPMKRRTDAPMTYRAPEVRRKLTPVKPPVSAPFKPEPALEEAEYQQILTVMDNMTKVIERSPHTFEKMQEEDLRQHFLVQLNGQYEGQASGETFNFQGKTDILIRSEGRNIFIAECKFWRGEKGFLETVDQLLSYLSWRDSKVAVVVFNKNKHLSGVLATIRTAMEKHPHKKQGPKIEGETRFRYVMGNPTDHDREIILTVMIYDIPTIG